MQPIIVAIDIKTPDDWTERETRLLLLVTTLASRTKILESHVGALADAIGQIRDATGVPDPGAASRAAQIVAADHAAIQAGIDLVTSIFPDVAIRPTV